MRTESNLRYYQYILFNYYYYFIVGALASPLVKVPNKIEFLLKTIIAFNKTEE
jgi:hypothetical protein